MRFGPGRHRRAVSSLCIAAALLTVGCELPPTAVSDYRVQHPVAARERVFSLILPVSASVEASAIQMQSISRFAEDYLRHGRGPLLVSQEGMLPPWESRSTVAATLRAAGVPNDRIFFQKRPAADGPPGSVELSYSGFVALVPQCGDWSGEAGFDPANRPHTNFGCAFQRNVGLMLSNPGDLSVPGQHVSRDATVSDRVIRTYREGKQLGSESPKQEQSEFSDVK